MSEKGRRKKKAEEDQPPQAEAQPEQPEQKQPDGPKRICLALQGGGSHGSFTWGVLDRLLDDDRLEIEGVSGTSAGAMNAAAMSHGFLQAGNPGAQLMLEEFWRKVSQAAESSMMKPSIFDRMMSQWNMDYSPAYMMYDMMSRMIPPEQLNPQGLDPLRNILNEEFDFEAIRRASPIKIFVTATNLTSGKPRVFSVEELNAEVLLASACLPSLFPPVEIDGEFFWDGGYVGNPSIFPLIYECQSSDIILVQINPIARNHMPTTAREIIDRINEVSFNSTLMREMRSIATMTRLIDDGKLDASLYKRVNVHIIEAEEVMQTLSPSSKMNAEWDFIEFLKGVGREAADKWIKEHFDDVGVRSSLDVFERFV